MLEYFQYPFFRYAVYGILIISVAAAIIGSYIITRRLVSISGGVTHACFGGLGLGYYLGVSPIAMAAVFAVASSVGVEWLSTKMRVREDSAIAVVWAVGMAIGVLFVFLSPGYVPELNSFLFGNILNISGADLMAFGIYLLVLIAFFCTFYSRIVACAFDRDFAQVCGLPVNYITYAMTILVALGIVLIIKMVGVMLLMAMLSLPMMTAEIFCRRYGSMMAVSAVISLLTSVGGLMLGAVVNVPCSAIIVLLACAVFIVARVAASLRHRLVKNN